MIKRIALYVNIFLGVFALLPPALNAAETPSLLFPSDCTLNENCWIANYPDTNPDENAASDFTCGGKTTDNHKGIDIALKSRAEMTKGIGVRAAADGKVLRTRDGESDALKTPQQLDVIRKANKDCGNGVILDHGNGLQTYYCHLRLGSIKVKPGQEVSAGDVIADIGNSGLSEFPHLYFSVIWEGGYVDPYTGVLLTDGCGQSKQSLWSDEQTYTPFAVFDAGFADKVPDFTALQNDGNQVETLSPASPNLLFWTGFYQAQEGDQIELVITNPNEEIFARRTVTLDASRVPPSFQYVGRALNGASLQSGTYTGTATFTREGFAPYTFTRTIEIR